MLDRSHFAAAAVLCLAFASPPVPPARSQHSDAPLLRTFKVGDVQRYSVELTVRSEVTGQRPRRVGRQTFAEPFTDKVETTLRWQVARRVVAVHPDGSADIEETLHDFSDMTTVLRSNEQESAAADPLSHALGAWINRTQDPLRYRESRSGQLQGLGDNAAPVLDDAPPVLTLWLRRALRPTAALPARPPREGERWQEPRAVRLPPWINVQGTENGAWLSGPKANSSAELIDLLLVQEISGGAPAANDPQPAAGAPARKASSESGQARFHAESLNSLVHAGTPAYGGYGALHSATRAGIREVSRVVEGVPNLSEPAVFLARVGVQVRITVIE